MPEHHRLPTCVQLAAPTRQLLLDSWLVLKQEQQRDSAGMKTKHLEGESRTPNCRHKR